MSKTRNKSYPNNLQNNMLVTLIGMMGTGKSKFGRLVSNALDFNFYDTDFLIEKKCKTSIKEIFTTKGEAFFRLEEKKTIKNIIFDSLNLEKNSIISIGGGAFDDKETRELLISNTKVIWLNTPPEILINRIGNGLKRPMIKGDIKNSINNILNNRIKYYSLCHYEIKTDNLNQKQIIKQIINLI